MHITLIHNTKAGFDQLPPDELISIIQNAGYEVEYCSYKEENFVSYLQNPGKLVAIAGGDGTVQKVAQHLIGRHTPTAILPLGTANNIANSLGIAGSPQELIAGWKNAEQKKIDVGVASGPWGEEIFFESVGFGLFCQLIREKKNKIHNAESRQDKLDQALEQLQKTLSTYQPHACQIKLDGQELSGDYLLIEAMNIQSVGPKIALAPEADPGDGLLDVIMIAAEERDVLSEYILERLAGRKASKTFNIYRAKELEVVWKSTDFHIDDDVFEKKNTDPLHIFLKPQQLTFLVNE